jgi:endonuclease YncB( thermonuclease family)
MPKIAPGAKKRTWQGHAEILAVHDGDTFTALIDLGFGVLKHCPVRIEGINTPELPAPTALRARDFLQTLIAPGDVVTLDSRRLDLHGRAQAHVLLSDGRDVGELMITSGHAQPADKNGNV